MRVCVLVPRFPAVSETFVVDHVVGLLGRGHEVVVVPMRPPIDPSVPDEWRDVVARTAPPLAGPRPRLRALRHALSGAHRQRSKIPERLRYGARVAAAAPFDVMHAQFGDAGVVAVEMRDAGIFRAPIVTSFHGYDANVRPLQRPDLYDVMAEKCEMVTVGSEFMRTAVGRLRFPPERIELWPQGVDTKRFGAVRRGRRDGLHVVTVARLIDVKGIDVSLRAVALARASIANLRYTVIGEGELQPELEALASSLGVADITRFAGALPHEQVRAVLADSDVFLLTGRTDRQGHTEAQGVAPLEASATGLPVVATRSGGLAEVVVDGVTGVLVDPEDASATAAALVSLADDPAARERLGAAGRDHVVRSFSREHGLDLIEGFYRRCLETARR